MIKNIEAAKQLIDKYQDFIDNQRLNYEPKKEPYYKALHKHTGFGDANTCTLCQVVTTYNATKTMANTNCKECVWSTTYHDSKCACQGENYNKLTECDISFEEFYGLLEDRIGYLKDAIEASEQLNKEEENE